MALSFDIVLGGAGTRCGSPERNARGTQPQGSLCRVGATAMPMAEDERGMRWLRAVVLSRSDRRRPR
jgi:hypothetical protein